MGLGEFNEFYDWINCNNRVVMISRRKHTVASFQVVITTYSFTIDKRTRENLSVISLVFCDLSSLSFTSSSSLYSCCIYVYVSRVSSSFLLLLCNPLALGLGNKANQPSIGSSLNLKLKLISPRHAFVQRFIPTQRFCVCTSSFLFYTFALSYSIRILSQLLRVYILYRESFGLFDKQNFHI